MQNAGEHFCLITCRDIIFYHFLVHEAIYERFFTVLRHIIWQERQEMRQNCGYPLHELHFAVHRKDSSMLAYIVVAFSHSFHQVNGMGVVREVGDLRELARILTPLQEVECFCQHAYHLLLGPD